MHLITMAHLGEAQGVIEYFNLKRITPHYFEGELLCCLITGEGPFEAATTTSHYLGQKKFNSVINLGIAGTLSDDFKVGEIYGVRSIYLIIDGKPQFKSFKSFEKGADCLTSFERIVSSQKANKLSGIGHLVDREAWGVAMAAKTCGVSFKCFKLISDVAGTIGACEIVRDNAQNGSLQLAQFLQNIIEDRPSEKNHTELQGFHFTVSTRHKFEQMLKKISIREAIEIDDVAELFNLDELREQKILPKDRTRLLLNQMENKLDPLKEKLESGLQKWKTPLEREGIFIQTDSTWESNEVKLSFSAKTQLELEQKIEILRNLKFKPFENLRNGNFNVE